MLPERSISECDVQGCCFESAVGEVEVTLRGPAHWLPACQRHYDEAREVGMRVRGNSRMICDHEGCDRGPFTTGHGLYRVSSKGPGRKFVGLCEEHYAGPPDPVVQAIEDHNRGGRS